MLAESESSRVLERYLPARRNHTSNGSHRFPPVDFYEYVVGIFYYPIELLVRLLLELRMKSYWGRRGHITAILKDALKGDRRSILRVGESLNHSIRRILGIKL